MSLCGVGTPPPRTAPLAGVQSSVGHPLPRKQHGIRASAPDAGPEAVLLSPVPPPLYTAQALASSPPRPAPHGSQ